MTNYKCYKESIDSILQRGENIAFNIDTKEVVSCQELSCVNCLFNENDNCDVNKIKWIVAEYVDPEIDWTKVPINTPVLVSNDRINWVRRYFAEVIETGTIYVVYAGGTTRWSSNGWMEQYKYAKLIDENKVEQSNGI